MTKLLRKGACVGALLVLAACSGSGVNDTATTPSATTSTPASTAWQMVGLGDSFTATQDSTGHTYLDLFQQSLEAHVDRDVEFTDLSDDANTSARLLDDLRHDDALRAAVADAEIILISVGGNDSDPFGVYPKGTCTPQQRLADCLNAYAPPFADNYESILAEVDALRQGEPTALRVTSADNPFVGWTEAPDATFGVRFYRQVAEAETRAACAAATRHGGRCVDYLHVFGGPDGTEDPGHYLAQDHAHPGDAGIAAIAGLLDEIGVPELG